MSGLLALLFQVSPCHFHDVLPLAMLCLRSKQVISRLTLGELPTTTTPKHTYGSWGANLHATPVYCRARSLHA